MKLRTIKGTDEQPEIVAFACPGCGEEHQVWVNGTRNNNSASWGFNGSFERPTFTPSILITSGHYVPGYGKDRCWCTYKQEHPNEWSPSCGICHSFVTDGKIQFLGDCTHHLAGQTVELPEVDEQGLPIVKTD